MLSFISRTTIRKGKCDNSTFRSWNCDSDSCNWELNIYLSKRTKKNDNQKRRRQVIKTLSSDDSWIRTLSWIPEIILSRFTLFRSFLDFHCTTICNRNRLFTESHYNLKQHYKMKKFSWTALQFVIFSFWKKGNELFS